MEQSGYISEWQNLLLTLTSFYDIQAKGQKVVYKTSFDPDIILCTTALAKTRSSGVVILMLL